MPSPKAGFGWPWWNDQSNFCAKTEFATFGLKTMLWSDRKAAACRTKMQILAVGLRFVLKVFSDFGRIVRDQLVSRKRSPRLVWFCFRQFTTKLVNPAACALSS
jgi:hypothetical protein